MVWHSAISVWCVVIGNKILFALFYICSLLCSLTSGQVYHLIIPHCGSVCAVRVCNIVQCSSVAYIFASTQPWLVLLFNSSECERREKPSGMYMLKNMLFMLEFIRWKIIFRLCLESPFQIVTIKEEEEEVEEVEEDRT